MDALDILTEDCWTEVFKKVLSAADLKACSETCALFETILNRRRSSWMLGAIIPLIFNYLNLQEEQDWARVTRQIRARNGDDEQGERVPFWRPVLRTRLVSRTLCDAVDTHVEKACDRGRYGYPLDWPRAPYFFCQDNVENMDEFLQKFETHRGNPFIGRSIEVVHFRREHDDTRNPRAPYNQDDDRREAHYLVQLVLLILGKFGHNIWTFKFYEWEHYQHLRFCKALLLLLVHLPNVRNLDFRHPIFGLHRIEDPECLDERDRQEGMDELTPYLTAQLLPVLPHLETLDVKGLSIKMGLPLVEKYAPHLKCLRMFDCRPFLQCAGRFNCLRELDLWVDAGNTLEGLRMLKSPLEILSLEVRWNKTNLGLYDIQELLLNLRHLPLTDLKIATGYTLCPIAESVPISPDLHIESIRKLQIMPSSFTQLEAYIRPRISFNFLLCLTGLEEVKVFLSSNSGDITAPHPRGIPEQLFVKELLLADDLYASDIWERIPSLKKFSFNYRKSRLQTNSWNSYSRGGYKEWKLANKKS